jgi:hypothetical protein
LNGGYRRTGIESMLFENAIRFPAETKSMTRMESGFKRRLKYEGNGIRLPIRFYGTHQHYSKEVYKESRSSDVFWNE